jgi:hypothetical protein
VISANVISASRRGSTQIVPTFLSGLAKGAVGRARGFTVRRTSCGDSLLDGQHLDEITLPPRVRPAE